MAQNLAETATCLAHLTYLNSISTFLARPLVLALTVVTLAKAVTTQGLTLDAARIDIRAAREPGQAYVALSRVRTLGGIYLTEWPKGWFISEEALAFERRAE